MQHIRFFNIFQIDETDLSSVIIRDLDSFVYGQKINEGTYPGKTIEVTPSIDVDDEDTFVRPSDSADKPVKDQHTYMHFGLEAALLGESLGMVYREEYGNIVRTLDEIDKTLFPEQFLNKFFKEERDSEIVSCSILLDMMNKCIIY